MGPIDTNAIQPILDRFANQDLYLHLETTTGAYANLRNQGAMTVCAYIRNGLVRYQRGAISGSGPYRVGLKIDQGWIYAEGLTDWELDGEGRLLLAGHGQDGGLAVALQLSPTPFHS